MADLTRHLETYLGPIEAGWSKDYDARPMPFQVVRFAEKKDLGAMVYCTLGLSASALPSPTSSMLIRHELIMLEPPGAQLGIPNTLQQLGLEAMKAQQAFLRGDVIGPRGTLWPQSAMEALYVSVPVYFPEAFASCGAVVLAWLFPITASEANYVRDRGFRAFEALLLEHDPNLVDIHRPSVVRDAMH